MEEMNAPPVLKKPKTERREDSNGGGVAMAMADDNGDSRDDQEEALMALIEHRTKEVEHLRKRIAYYQAQVVNSITFITSYFPFSDLFSI